MCMYVCMYAMYMYVCMYVCCMYVCVCVCLYVCTFICMYVYMYVCLYVCIYACVHMFTCVSKLYAYISPTHIHTAEHTDTQLSTHTHTHTHTAEHTDTQLSTHTHTHTHTHTWSASRWTLCKLKVWYTMAFSSALISNGSHQKKIYFFLPPMHYGLLLCTHLQR